MSPETRVPVTLTAAQWNTVLQMLAEQPYRITAPLISEIQQQVQKFIADGDSYQHPAGRSPASWKAAE
jgi:hypothetical protein